MLGANHLPQKSFDSFFHQAPKKYNSPPLTMAFSGDKLPVGKETHIALFPSSGMGHLTPFLRLASLLLHHHCRVTLITTNPTVSHAESRLVSRFFSSYPQVTQIHFNLLPLDLSTVNSTDPFWIQSETIRRSAHLLSPLLSSVSSPPLSGLISDVMLVSYVLPVAQTLRLPNYILFTSSARMFSFFAYLPTITSISNVGSVFDGEDLHIPGINSPLPRSSIPPLLLIQNSLFANMFFSDSSKLSKLDGVLINSFEGLETESLETLLSRKLMEDLPPVFAVGPFEPCEFEKEEEDSHSGSDSSTALAKWLDEKPDGSVVYISFGSRTALSKDQTREVGDGLVKSGFKFLWVVKNKQVDKEEEEGDLEEVIGEELMEKIKENGLVVKNWVDQGKILGHKAVGGFVSHCGWNSMVEAAINGVRVLGWPQHGDQKINAEVVEGSGLGMWVRNWGWGGEKVVKGDEIGARVREMMESQSLKVKARDVGEEAMKAAEAGGNREEMFKELIEDLKRKL